VPRTEFLHHLLEHLSVQALKNRLLIYTIMAEMCIGTCMHVGDHLWCACSIVTTDLVNSLGSTTDCCEVGGARPTITITRNVIATCDVPLMFHSFPPAHNVL
jgi:hypothetical protein